MPKIILIGGSAFIVLTFSIIIFTVGFMALYAGINETPYSTIAGTPTEVATAEIPPELLPIFVEAGEKYNVSWAILAAICKIESTFGTYPNGSVSSAGAVGLMQFMPTTWSGHSNPYLPRNDKNWKPLGEGSIYIFYNSVNDPNLPYDTNPERIAKSGGYGVDADGDGYADPYNPYDAIYSTAYMLSKNLESSSDYFYSAKMSNVLVHYSGGSQSYANTIMAQAKLYSNVDMPGEQPIWPVSTKFKTITSPYGYRTHPVTGLISFHRGMDIADFGIDGADIYAIFNAKILEVGYSRAEGYFVQYQNLRGDTKVYCCHIKEGTITVKPGDIVPQGYPLAKVGNSGSLSTGSHLHIEIAFAGKNINPLPYLQRGLNYQIKTTVETEFSSGNY